MINNYLPNRTLSRAFPNLRSNPALDVGIALILLGTLTRGNWIIGLKLLCAIFLVMLVLYWKIAPFKQQLFPKYQKAFGITERIFMRLQNILGFIPKIQMGQRLQLDTSLIVCIFFTLLILVVL